MPARASRTRLLRRRCSGSRFYARKRMSRNWRSRKVRNTRRVREVSRIVALSPVLYDLATGDMKHVDGLILHPLADRSESLELSQVDAPPTDAGRHPIFFGHHVLDGDAKRPRDALEGISWAGAKTISGR